MLMANNGGLVPTQSFARLFLVLGMAHCSGGQALDEFDLLAAVVNWVESGGVQLRPVLLPRMPIEWK